MNIYKSKLTGTILQTESVIISQDWDDITPKEEKKPVKKDSKKVAKKEKK